MTRGELLRPGTWRMATRVAASASGLLAILLVIVVLTHAQTREQRQRDEVDHARDVASALTGTVDGFLSDLEATVLSVIMILEGEETVDQATAGTPLTAVRAEYAGLVRTIFVTDLDGDVIASDSGTGVGAEVRERPYMQALMDGSERVWSEGFTGQASGETLVTYGHRMDAPDGSARGYVLVVFQPRAFMARMHPFIPSGSAVTLIDPSGLPLYTTEADEDGRVDASERITNPDILPALRGQTVAMDRMPGFFTDEERFGAIVPLERTGWAVAFTRPLAPLEATLRGQLLQQVGIVAAAVVGVAAVFTMITNHITQPLASLAAAATAVGRGERPTVPRNGESEVRQLADSMDGMIREVAEREDALRRDAARRSLLAEASRAFSEASFDQGRVLSEVARRVSEAMGDGCMILLRRDDAHLVPAHVHHRQAYPQEMVRTLMPPLIPEDGPGITSQVVRSGKSVLAAHVQREEFRTLVAPNFGPYVDEFGAHSLTAHPLRVRGRLTGVLVMWRDVTRDAYTEDDHDLLQDIANRAALAIENARLFEDVTEHAVAVDRAMHAHVESVALVSHDLKNPLATVRATAQWVRRSSERGRPSAPDDLQRAMQSIEQASQRASEELDAVLDAATVQAGGSVALTRARVDLVSCVRGLCEVLQERSPGHPFHLNLPRHPVEGEWDLRRLERAVTNLLENALKYSPEGGPVHVGVSLLACAGDEGGAIAVLTIRDAGVGIPAAALPRVFDRFYRAENAAEFAGHGLGLTGVRHIVEAHGGSVHVESQEGRGSTFTVRLPCSPPLREPRPEGSTSNEGTQSTEGTESTESTESTGGDDRGEVTEVADTPS